MQQAVYAIPISNIIADSRSVLVMWVDSRLNPRVLNLPNISSMIQRFLYVCQKLEFWNIPLVEYWTPCYPACAEYFVREMKDLQ